MSKEESLFEAMGGTYRSVDGILYPNISFLQERMILETDDEGKCLDKLCALNTQDVLCDNHVTCRRDRKKLRKSLYNCNNYC